MTAEHRVRPWPPLLVLLLFLAGPAPAAAQAGAEEWDLVPAPGVDAAGTVRAIHQPDGSLALSVDFSGPPDLVRMREDGTPGVFWNLVGTDTTGMKAGFARSCLDVFRGLVGVGLLAQFTPAISVPGRQQFTTPLPAGYTYANDLLMVIAGWYMTRTPPEPSHLLACADLTQPARRPGVLPNTGAATLLPWLGATMVLLVGIGLALHSTAGQTCGR